jgi:uncharacterized protein YjfI (DUF2170 family)
MRESESNVAVVLTDGPPQTSEAIHMMEMLQYGDIPILICSRTATVFQPLSKTPI